MTSYHIWYNYSDIETDHWDLHLSNVEITQETDGTLITGYVENGAWYFEMKNKVVKCKSKEYGNEWVRRSYTVDNYYMRRIQ